MDGWMSEKINGWMNKWMDELVMKWLIFFHPLMFFFIFSRPLISFIPFLLLVVFPSLRFANYQKWTISVKQQRKNKTLFPFVLGSIFFQDGIFSASFHKAPRQLFQTFLRHDGPSAVWFTIRRVMTITPALLGQMNNDFVWTWQISVKPQRCFNRMSSSLQDGV